MEESSEQSAELAASAAEAEAATTVEAILFASDCPLTAAKIAAVAELPPRVVKVSVETLNKRYEQIETAFRIEAIAGGYQMLTRREYHDVLGRLLRARRESKLSQAAMETLAIIAYRQPILRADIEAIRGVACGELLRGLMEKGLVKIIGRAEVLGRPMLYGTTRRFLEAFGLAGLDGLPRVEELRSGALESQPSAKEAPEPSDSEEITDGDEADNNEPQPPGSGQYQPATETERAEATSSEEPKAQSSTDDQSDPDPSPHSKQAEG